MQASLDTSVVISSYLALLKRGSEPKTIAKLEALEGVEVHGAQHGQYILSIELKSVDATYRRATEITRMNGVTTLSLVYCNFEDETLGAIA